MQLQLFGQPPGLLRWKGFVQRAQRVGVQVVLHQDDPFGGGVVDDGARKYVWGLGLAYEVEGSNAFVYHTDGLRSVRAVSDSSGATIQTYRTDEFGVPLDTQGTSAQPFQYTGEEGDETGLVFLRARYYEPGIGRFTSRDQAPGSLARPQMLSRYPT